uniref:Subtelomeric hrmA-associated cluster protein AFUB-079030/YDR124W-like helical bundle domain-containing protein n=1 Tax=Melanopsichium pennsylvanicum 4 TaxID=1398559 RepID=A0A077R5R2_9BASI|nr:conserved hypothetical protein [Melanopsichium pennsylvanicum 4]
MPRIPVRVEPYSSPSRQHRHYKNKRDQVLRALGKAAYINGSHFAIMWVSARGHVETYASEALQSSLDDWFVKGGIAEEAKQLVKNNSAKANSGSSGEAIAIFEDLSDDDVEDDAGNEAGNEVVLDDVFLDSNNSDRSGNKPRRAGKEVKRSPLAPLNTAIANQHFLRSRNSWNNASNDLVAPKSAPLFPSTSSDFPLNNDSQIPQTSTPILAASTRFNTRASLSSLTPTISQNLFTSSSSSSPLHTITLSTEAARTAFLELRFGQLQQSVCKTVAKAWIKIIEPKKQTRCPYNKGESGKPDWWPTGVRHKEPDHLMKPERHSLLLTILRSTKVRVARLQLATAEVVALIKADKVSLLMDVYRVAREEEKIRDKAVENGNKKESEEDKVEMEVKVGVSTLDGWCKEGSEPTMAGRQIARSATPEIVSEKSNSKKRSAASMVKSNSTSATTGTNSVSKRRSIASTTSLSVENRPRALPHTSIFGAAGAGGCTTTLHTNNNMIGLGLIAPQPRSHSFSGAFYRSQRSGYTSYWFCYT